MTSNQRKKCLRELQRETKLWAKATTTLFQIEIERHE